MGESEAEIEIFSWFNIQTGSPAPCLLDPSNTTPCLPTFFDLDAFSRDSPLGVDRLRNVSDANSTFLSP
ncbi:hypothetical protein H0H92_008205 [Tricholoma furcatifolium]|nr:hypothetical protein H0H92_008205 [Tricholoma furcatifolium]